MTRAKVEVLLGELTEKNVGHVRVLNDNVFPVSYNDTFYTNLHKFVALSQLGNNRANHQFFDF